MAAFPTVTLNGIPEDNECDVTSTPTDDDGLPAQLDSPVAFSAASGNCVVTQPPTAGDHAGDAAWATVTPNVDAKNGDTVSVLATIVSQGETSTQQGDIPLTAGGAASAGFGQSPPRKVVR